jgi:hypothetical protein
MRTLIITEQDRQNFIRRIQEFPIGKTYVAEFKVYRKLRSLKQNRLLHLWLKYIRIETGNEEEAIHLFFKERFLQWTTKDVFGEQVSLIPSTKNLDTKQFTEYLECIRVFMLEQGIFLPQPGEREFDEFYARYGLN